MRHPSTVLTHIATKNTGLLFLALGIPFLFLPLARPRYLLLILPILLQNLLTSYGGTPLIAETHYVTLLLPGLFLAMIAALLHPPRFIAVFPLRLLLIVATLYSMSTLGPLYGVITERTPRDTLQSRDFFISQIPLNASLATTESFLTQLSRREKLYLLRYAIAGKTQFDKTPYRLPENIQYILLDADDVLSYAQDAEAMRDTFAPFKIIAAEKSFFLLTRGTGISLLQPNKQKTPDATIAREVPCSLPPLAACTRLAINTDSKEGNAIMVNDDPNNLFPSFFASYWLPDDAINDIAIGTATTTTALTRDRGTRYVREFNDERNLAISQQ